MDSTVSKFFYLWKKNLKVKKEFKRIISNEEFNQLKEEELDEIAYAEAMNMETIYWCWACKYGDCDRH